MTYQYFGGGHLSGLGGQKSGKKKTFKGQKSGHLNGGFLGHLSGFLEIGVDIWAEHILLIICDLIQLVPLPSDKFSHFKLILLPPAHQRGGGSRS